MTTLRKTPLNERTIVKELARKLETRNRLLGEKHEQYLGKILSLVTPAKSRKIDSILKNLYGGVAPPLQPDIDLLFRNNEDIRAVEVKVFSITGKGRLSRSYYEGIDQALALLMLGFNKVALWHIFDQDVGIKWFGRYGSSLQLFVREQLKLPIDFTALYLIRNGLGHDFVPTQPRVTNFQTMQLVDVRLLRKIDDPQFPFVWKTSNPLMTYPTVISTRKAILEWLDLRDG